MKAHHYFLLLSLLLFSKLSHSAEDDCEIPVFTNLDAQICSGESFPVGSNHYNESGIYTDTLLSIEACDSIVTLNLNVLPAVSTQQAVSICEGQSFLVGNSIYTTAGLYRDTLSTVQGCDSIVFTNLSVRSTFLNNHPLSICQGQSVTIGSNTYTLPGNYFDTLSTVFGCDSIIFTQLTVRERQIQNVDISICNGDQIQVGNSVYSATGLYSDTLTNIVGCDSIILTRLTVHPVFDQVDDIKICNDQSYTVGTSIYTQAGNYTDTLLSVFGCDSIIRTNLSVVNEIVVEQDISICKRDSIIVGNSIYKEAGTYIDTLLGAGGCDSIVITHLRLDGKVDAAKFVSICQGSTFSFGDTTIGTSGIYTRFIINPLGCDSLITLNLTVNPTKQTNISLSACTGDTIVVEGQSYTQNADFNINKQSFLGCDSTIRYNIRFQAGNLRNEQVNICIPGSFLGIPISSDTSITRQFQNIFGCDSIIVYQIKAILPNITEAFSSLCIGTPYEGLIISKDTILIRRLENSFGCDSTVTEFITALPLPILTVSRDTTINPGSNVTLFASGATSYQWNTGQTGPVISVAPTTSTVFSVIGTAENGCSQKADITVSVNACQIEVPTLFTPNDDGIHDLLSIKGAECLLEFSMAVLNRWGDVVFETKDLNLLWDGMRNGNKLPEGVYYYILSGRSVADGFPVLKKGYVHLKR
jgi:gliding motility-associated-like protein